MARCKDKEDASELIKWVSSVRCVVKVTPHSVLKTVKEDLDIDLGWQTKNGVRTSSDMT
jgi:hypothetical protein